MIIAQYKGGKYHLPQTAYYVTISYDECGNVTLKFRDIDMILHYWSKEDMLKEWLIISIV